MTELSYDRRFSVHTFSDSHGLLLLRSAMTQEHPSRVDILFRDVVWMSLPVWMDGVAVEECELGELPTALPELVAKEAARRRAFRITTQGTAQYVVAVALHTAEDQLGYFEPSSLVPNSPAPATGG
jgi:hypothetical protein